MLKEKFVIAAILLFLSISGISASAVDMLQNDNAVAKPRVAENLFTRILRSFNDVDTNYIEPQHYNYTVMLQNTNTYEGYTLKSSSGQSISFSPRPTMKIGPYVGWRWLFLGYTFDINNMHDGKNKREFDLSLYTSMLGIDLYYRKSGDNYRINSCNIIGSGSHNALKGVPFTGINSSIKGFDIYYIFNHRKFSYPAAFSQTTCQKRSYGSPLLGIGYTNHKVSLDHERLQETLREYAKKMPDVDADKLVLDSGLMFNSVEYSSFSFSGGYAYNWVFAKNCLLSASLSLAVAYKQSEGDRSFAEYKNRTEFSFKNFNLDGIGRFGFVWNDRKWYVGASSVMHAYNYKKSRFSTMSYIGSFNVYAGMNFGIKREYKKLKK